MSGVTERIVAFYSLSSYASLYRPGGHVSTKIKRLKGSYASLYRPGGHVSTKAGRLKGFGLKNKKVDRESYLWMLRRPNRTEGYHILSMPYKEDSRPSLRAIIVIVIIFIFIIWKI
jgi:hypothetical protein